MMRINWFATTALAALVGTGAAWAQTQEPQQRHEQRNAPQAQQEHKQPAAQNAQREEHNEKNATGRDASPRQAQGNAPEQNEMKKQGNEPSHQNAQSEKPSQGADQQRASETRKGHDRNAREENRREQKHQGQARTQEQNRSSQAQENTKPQKQNQNAAQNRQSPENGKNARQNQAATPSKQGNTASTASQSDPSKQNASTTSTSNTASSAKLSESDRTKVFSRLSQNKSTTRESVNIQVSVGERLPPRVRPHRLPADIVTIMPAYRGYDYVMVQDEIAIVRPGTREVVDVIREGGPTVARSSGSTHITLSTDQRQLLLRETRAMKSTQVSSSGPTCLPMQPLPQSIVSQNPDLRGLELIKIGDEAVLVDPKDQKIVDVIRQ